MIVSLTRTVYFLRLKAKNTAVTEAGHGTTYGNMGKFLLESVCEVSNNDDHQSQFNKRKEIFESYLAGSSS